MYSITSYGKMIADHVRTEAYAHALRRAIKPDSVVLDIGTGIGIFAMLACQFGARRVYAIEPDDAVQVARTIAADNGFANRIEFIQELSSRITLSERVDLIVSDLRGVLPLFRHHIPSIIDARKRFLAPDGILIPQQDTLWAAVSEAPDLYERYSTLWSDNAYGLDLGAARRLAVNTWQKGRVASDQLLTPPQQWATLDYYSIESANISAEMIFTAMRAGTAHGLSLWFDGLLAEGVSFSNAPGQPELIYGSAFFPFSSPVTLAVGDRVSVKLSADLVVDDYVWRWNTQVAGQGDEIKADFKQSTFFGAPLSPNQLRKRESSYVPALDKEGQIDRLILSLMNGQNSLSDIAHTVATDFPDRFKSWQDALNRAGELSVKYSNRSGLSHASQ
ncbi:MAG TPA: 50S ribosomal protein L11 methyltransferase [Blastocatellia bacterium]|nr:50S ribosomal protein L11 methyltransferase [Blastocatellia bacterium]